MKTGAVIVAGSLLLAAPAAFGQIVTPTLSPPPCTGPRCFLHPRGATTRHVAAPSVLKVSCPQGTVYDAYKGTCRVGPVPR